MDLVHKLTTDVCSYFCAISYVSSNDVVYQAVEVIAYNSVSER
jgi:hypothetical protein